MRTYLSGPVSGIPENNAPAFHAEATRLRAEGFDVVNPHELGIPPDAAWADCMRVDIRELMLCDTIRMLPGWQDSRGAKLELRIALELGFKVSFADRAEISQPVFLRW